jgi:dolichol kinase
VQVGVVAISQMAAGDGMADIIGRKFGTVKWPFSKDKSYIGTSVSALNVRSSGLGMRSPACVFRMIGTLAFVVAGFLVTLGITAWFKYWGLIAIGPSDVMFRIALISVACAFVELVSRPCEPVTLMAKPGWRGVSSSLASVLLLCPMLKSPPTAWKLPLGDDNISVPAAASVLAALMLPSQL